MEPTICLLGTSIKKFDEKGQEGDSGRAGIAEIFVLVVVINGVVENAIRPLIHSFKNNSFG